jgi:hypothetical protein
MRTKPGAKKISGLLKAAGSRLGIRLTIATPRPSRPLVTRRRRRSEPNSRLSCWPRRSLRMRNSCWTPSIVPDGDDQTVYLVAEDFGQLGVPGAKPTMKRRTLETVIQDLLSGQYNNPIRVVAFNTEERWSEDVSEDVAHELALALRSAGERCALLHSRFRRAARRSCSAAIIASIGLKRFAFLPLPLI